MPGVIDPALGDLVHAFNRWFASAARRALIEALGGTLPAAAETSVVVERAALQSRARRALPAPRRGSRRTEKPARGTGHAARSTTKGAALREAIEAAVRQAGAEGISPKHLAEACHATVPAIRLACRPLVAAKVIRQEGRTTNARWVAVGKSSPTHKAPRRSADEEFETVWDGRK